MGFSGESASRFASRDAGGTLTCGLGVVARPAQCDEVGELVASACGPVVDVVGVEGAVALVADVPASLAGVAVPLEAGLL